MVVTQRLATIHILNFRTDVNNVTTRANGAAHYFPEGQVDQLTIKAAGLLKIPDSGQVGTAGPLRICCAQRVKVYAKRRGLEEDTHAKAQRGKGRRKRVFLGSAFVRSRGFVRRPSGLRHRFRVSSPFFTSSLRLCPFASLRDDRGPWLSLWVECIRLRRNKTCQNDLEVFYRLGKGWALEILRGPKRPGRRKQRGESIINGE